MTTTNEFVQLCRDLAAQSGCGPSEQCSPTPETSESESLIGFFQLFRPKGENLEGLFDSLPVGEELSGRLQSVFQHAGDDRRPAGGRDAYFIVRSPKSLSVEHAEHRCTQWISGLAQIAGCVGEPDVADRLSKDVKIRVLEGIPPKHPKEQHERSSLLSMFLDQCTKMTSKVAGVDPHAELLRPAYYFMACDPMLRDYMMWPFYAAATGLADPLLGYFALWTHGVKYRIFREDQIDLYLPRNPVAG